MTKDQPKPDIQQLSQRELPQSRFPAKSDLFRVFFDPAAHSAVQQHARRNLSVEVGGVLVGQWKSDSGGPFVTVRSVICSELAASGAGELTFTHNAWAEIHKVMDAEHPDAKIVGWYHTHPDFGVFLSERDQFIHEHFFSDPGQIAYVVDPIREQEGVFVWQGGKTALCQHYWVGDEIRMLAERPEDRSASGFKKSQGDPAPVIVPSRGARSEWLLLSLLGILFFLVGYLLADRLNWWKQSRLIDGVVAHFAMMGILRPGLKEHLDVVDQEISRLEGSLATVRPKEREEKTPLGQAELDEWSLRLRQIRAVLDRMETIYCAEERQSQLMAELSEDFARLRGGLGQPLPDGAAPNPAGSKPAGRREASSAPSTPASESPAAGVPAPVPSRPAATPGPAEPKAKGGD